MNLQEGNFFQSCLFIILSRVHVTITHDTLDLTIQERTQPWLPIPYYTGTPLTPPDRPHLFTGHVQTCLLWLASGLFTSYWNDNAKYSLVMLTVDE